MGTHQWYGTAASEAAPLRLPALPGGNVRPGSAARADQKLSAGECSQWFLVLQFPVVSRL